MASKLSDSEWADIKRWWETTPGTKNAKAQELADEYGLHRNTFETRARREEWHNPEEGEDVALNEVREAVEHVAPDWMGVEDKARMASRIQELERELAASRKTVEDLRPDTDVSHRLFDSIEDVKAWFSDEHLRTLAMGEIALVNKERMKQGHPPLTAEQMQPSEQQIEEQARQILADRRRGIGSPPFTRKMAYMKPVFDGCNGVDDQMQPKACYTHGNMVKLPIEDQVNNFKGSMYDATHRYLEKGYKLLNPIICMAGECWEPAAVDTRGKPIYRGFCTPSHLQGTPAESQSGDRTVLGAINAGNVRAFA